MRQRRTILGFVLLIGGSSIFGPASAQQYRGTYEQQMACTPDVWRLCGSEVPDASRIVACLQQNTPRLSPGCRAVFETGAASPQAGPNRRVVRPQPYPPPYAMRPGPPPGPYYGAPPSYYDDDY